MRKVAKQDATRFRTAVRAPTATDRQISDYSKWRILPPAGRQVHIAVMSEPTSLFLPPHFPYPIKIVAHAVGQDSSIERGTRLLSYSFTHRPIDHGQPSEVRFATWDSPIEGAVQRWGFKPGETVSARKAKEIPAIYVTEPCKHGVQMAGLCCLCGKDMTE